jgi:hypothetical protein
MQLRFDCNRFFLILALLLGSSVSAFGESTGDSATQPAPSEIDFTVTAAAKEASHPFFGKGNSLGFIVNGVPGASLTLVRGKTYTFSIDTGPMHDFYISKNPRGWGGGTVTEGVDGNFTYKGYVTFKPSAATPDLVYYACRNHQYMGGEIHVVNPGEEGKSK